MQTITAVRASARPPQIQLGQDRRVLDPAHRFTHFGEFLQAVRREPVHGASALGGPSSGRVQDERLLIGAVAPGTSGSEGIGVDGGFAVPPAFAEEVMTLAQLDGLLVPLLAATPVTANQMTFPSDETPPWTGTGLRAFWQNELAAAPQQRPTLKIENLRMHKLQSLVPLTDELVRDAAALTAYLPARLSAAMAWRINEAVLWGTGVGQPMGLFAGSAALVQAKESAQAASTLSIANLGKMFARLPAGSHSRAVFLFNPDALAQLVALGAPIVTLSEPPPDFVIPCVGSLLGVPVCVSPHAKAFSSQGDVLLFDGRYARCITKNPAMQAAMSLHVWFDADAVAFRATFRIDSAPAIQSPIQPAVGSTTLSPFVMLGAR